LGKTSLTGDNVISKEKIIHLEFSIALVLMVGSLFFVTTREIPVSVEYDTQSLDETNQQAISVIEGLASLSASYQNGLEELKSLSSSEGVNRLVSEGATVGRVFYINGEPFYYVVSLKEYDKAASNVMLNSVAKINQSYIRPLTADIEFLAQQFEKNYPDKTKRAMAILGLIQNLGYDMNDHHVVKHPTVTLMEGGVCIDLVLACGALLKAADIDCAILIFEDERHAAIGISDIDFSKFQNTQTMIVEYEGIQYLICETTSLRHPAGSDLMGSQGSIDASAVSLIIPYEFP
jgi:hypothetical protein